MKPLSSSFTSVKVISLLARLASLVSAQSDDSTNSPTADVYFPGSCPALCSDSGPSPDNWTHIHSVSDLTNCDAPLLFDLNVQNDLESPDNVITIRSCMVTGSPSISFSSQEVVQAQESQATTTGDDSTHPLLVSNSCGAKASEIQVKQQTGDMGDFNKQSSTSPQPKAGDVASAANNLGTFMGSGALCGATILFSKSGSAIVGLYSGSEVTNNGAQSFLDSFVKSSGSLASQVCTPANATLTVGAFAAPLEDLSAVQDVVRSWRSGQCLNGTAPSVTRKMEVLVPKIQSTASTTNSTSNSTSVARSLLKSRFLATRSDCRAIEVQSGDSCASLASRCGISGSDFNKYNQKSNLCSTLQPKQHVCCSAGDLPDYRPKPQSDGTCSVYKVASGDGCYDIADAHYLQTSDIEGFNKKTWGWAGCSRLQVGQKICLSAGNTPMPAIVQGTTCGPQVPGTTRPADGVDIATLNPCPLNACCDVWGFCGTTPDFCTKSPADTGAPGTAKPGTNGCISHCGMEILNNGSPPSSFRSIGYFEAFDQERGCLRMDVTHIPSNAYTHIHFAFATVTPSFTVDVSDSADQFYKFVKMTGFKKVLSFGGWAFSTDQGTFQRFRQATNSQNRASFVDSLLNFMSAYNLDGLDFDWEYPGAPDIPDITPGSKDEGSNYLAFLQLLKSKMPSGKTISIALPASYWYLQAYPVSKMAAYVDYFIYMTYDLHGQWDVGNKWAIPSCAGGNCLRSHVNKTETHEALVMLTKAGISSTKIIVGVTSYGRSFRMADPSCSGPFCKYTGDRNHSMAYPGVCTETGGYISNAEINSIIKNPGKYTIHQTSVDSVSASNILMYGVSGAVDWVAYMDGTVKSDRISWIKGLNMGGTTDWAIDLQTTDYDDDIVDDDDGSDTEDGSIDSGPLPNTCPASGNPGGLQGLADNAGSMENNCASLYGLDILYNQLVDALSLFQVNSQGYDDKFGWYEKWTKEQIQPRLDDYMSIYSGGKGLKYMTCYYSYGRFAEKKSSCMGMPHFWDDDVSWTIRFQLDDEQGFFDELVSTYGIDKSWVVFGDDNKDFSCAFNDNSGGIGPGGSGPAKCRKLTHVRKNVPLKAANDKIQVGNPKELIEASMSNVTALQTSILSSYLDVGLTFYDDGDKGGSPIDAVVAYSFPIFQMSVAIDSMKDIKDIGEKAKEDAKRNLIFKILTIVFMVIPFVGEALGPLVGSVTSVARIALLLGESGNAALTVADIIKDPSSAPFAILGLIAGAAGSGIGRTSALQKASSARKLMKDSDLAKFPQAFKDKDALVQQMVKKACAAK